MNEYIEPVFGELLNLWNDIIVYDVSRPIQQRKFQFHAMLVWKIHDAPGLTNFAVCNYKFHFNCIYFYELVNILCRDFFK